MTRDERWMHEEPPQPEPPTPDQVIDALIDALRAIVDYYKDSQVPEILEARALLKEITGD